MKNWYGYTIGDEDGDELFANSEGEALQFLRRIHGYDIAIEVYKIGKGDPDHWENEHMTNV
jgi:hypothetical protein